MSENAVNIYDLCTRKDAAGLWAPVDYQDDGVISVSKMIEADGSLSAAWLRDADECFVEDLVGLAPALGAERAELVRTFEIAIFRSNTHGDLSEIVVSLLADGGYALYYARLRDERKRLRMLDVREVVALRTLLEKIGVPRWRTYYNREDEWVIDDNYWHLELIGHGFGIKCSGSSAAPDGYAKLERAMFDLVGEDRRKRKRRIKKLAAAASESTLCCAESEGRAKAIPTRSKSGCEQHPYASHQFNHQMNNLREAVTGDPPI